MVDRGAVSLRQLNRTTLGRQLLLARAALPAIGGLERLVAMQAQLARPPFVGLWTRLDGFQRADLAEAIRARSVVKATLLRGTLHLLTTDDYLVFRPVLQPVLTNALEAVGTRTQKRRPSRQTKKRLLSFVHIEKSGNRRVTI